MPRLLLCVLLCTAPSIGFAADPPPAAKQKPFELLDGDRVVFLGNTLIEREQKYGYWELMLTMAWPERNVTFRNLGWSGDTVWGESRAGFGTQADGFKALVDQVNAAKPTVIFVGYGNVEAFDGEAGLPKFIDGFNRLLDELEKTKARIVVLGPILQMDRVSPNPHSDQYNAVLEKYSAAIRELTTRHGHYFCPFIDAYRRLKDADQQLTQPPNDARSNNGLDLNRHGYWWLSTWIAVGLQAPTMCFTPHGPTRGEESLRTLIIKKNELFFHRWRPQNETYLFGFRKHEQGNNAKEVFDFDPLIAAEEKKIAELRTKLAAELKKASESK